MKSDLGILQEELPSGKVTTSSMRILSFLSLSLLSWYLAVAPSQYEAQLNKYITLVTNNVISEQSFNALVEGLVKYEKWIIIVFIAGAFAPKAIQKLIENYSAIKEKKDE